MDRLHTKAHQMGKIGEQLAQDHLLDRGLKLLEKNFRSKQGEIDLIMQESDTIVFVEVRLRRDKRYGLGAESVTPLKQKRLINTAMYYLLLHPQYKTSRFDVVEVNAVCEPYDLTWLKNAFQLK